jgi:dihydropteroate synthase
MTATRHYLRPTGFIDAPFGYDGQFARLAGGLQFFGYWEVIAAQDGRRVSQQLVPVDRMDAHLNALPAEQADAVRATIGQVTAPRAALELGSRIIRLDQPQVMGILNMTPDSFSGGSNLMSDPAAAAALAIDMSAAGAAIIDIGGESTRPSATTVWEEDEKLRVMPLLQALAPSGTAISLDTRKAGVMEAGLAAGAHLINDVSALLYDDRSLEVVSSSTCPIVIMHSPGSHNDPHSNDDYADALIEVYDWLEDRVAKLVEAGIDRKRLIIDPGIGFGKGVAINLALMNGLSLFHGIGCPILVGASRKRMIGALSNEAPVDKRLGGSITLALKAAEQGAQIIRVHDVPETVQALRIWRGLRDKALSPG